MRLDQDPGPYDRLRGVMPADFGDRDGARFWLIQGPAFMFGARCKSVDTARALVLDHLGYGDRPELADSMNARPATGAEVNYVVAHFRRPALSLTKRNARRLLPIMVALFKHDIRASGDLRDGGTIGDLAS